MDNKKTKDSGIEWIGEIPEDWELNPISVYFYNRNEKVSDYDYEPLSVTKKGVVPQLEDAAKSNAHDDRKKVCIGDFVINSRSDRKQSCGLSNYDGSVSLINLVLVHKSGVCQAYSKYLLNNYGFAEEFYRWGTGIVADLWSTKWDLMKRIIVAIPNITTQHQIAEYLDKKCSQIDELIANNQSQIYKLKEYKQSVITQSVTKGLDPNVETKDSGIDWIGQIPKNWEVVRIKNIAHFNPIIKINQGIETISYAPMECVKNGWLIHNEISVNNISSGLTLFEENDIVMAKVTPCFENGNIAIATDLKNGIACGSSELFVFRSKNKFNKWLFYFLRNNIFKQRASATMTGTGGLKRVSPKFVSDYSLALPSLLEQQQIADYLDKKCSQIDSLIEIKQQKIEKLQEYKKSLIYEYVTGKKEVVC